MRKRLSPAWDTEAKKDENFSPYNNKGKKGVARVKYLIGTKQWIEGVWPEFEWLSNINGICINRDDK